MLFFTVFLETNGDFKTATFSFEGMLVIGPFSQWFILPNWRTSAFSRYFRLSFAVRQEKEQLWRSVVASAHYGFLLKFRRIKQTCGALVDRVVCYQRENKTPASS